MLILGFMLPRSLPHGSDKHFRQARSSPGRCSVCCGRAIFGTMSDHWANQGTDVDNFDIRRFTAFCFGREAIGILVTYRAVAGFGLGGGSVSPWRRSRGVASQQARPCIRVCHGWLACGSSLGCVCHSSAASGDWLARQFLLASYLLSWPSLSPRTLDERRSLSRSTRQGTRHFRCW